MFISLWTQFSFHLSLEILDKQLDKYKWGRKIVKKNRTEINDTKFSVLFTISLTHKISTWTKQEILLFVFICDSKKNTMEGNWEVDFGVFEVKWRIYFGVLVLLEILHLFDPLPQNVRYSNLVKLIKFWPNLTPTNPHISLQKISYTLQKNKREDGKVKRCHKKSVGSALISSNNENVYYYAHRWWNKLHYKYWFHIAIIWVWGTLGDNFL